jgi:hypothetical protein
VSTGPGVHAMRRCLPGGDAHALDIAAVERSGGTVQFALKCQWPNPSVSFLYLLNCESIILSLDLSILKNNKSEGYQDQQR